jgi:hypothetical protein
MYRHTKKRVAGYVQIQRQTPLIRSFLNHGLKSIHVLPLILNSTLPSIPIHFYSISSSVMRTSFASVTNKLESANNLSYREETQ